MLPWQPNRKICISTQLTIRFDSSAFPRLNYALHCSLIYFCQNNCFSNTHMCIEIIIKCPIIQLDVWHVSRQQSDSMTGSQLLFCKANNITEKLLMQIPEQICHSCNIMNSEFTRGHVNSTLDVSTIVVSCFSWRNIPLNLQIEDWDSFALLKTSPRKDLKYAESLNWKKRQCTG